MGGDYYATGLTQATICHVNVDFSSCFYMNQCVFSITGLSFGKRDKLLTGNSWLHQVLKKIFFQAILYTHEVYQKIFIKIFILIIIFNFYN